MSAYIAQLNAAVERDRAQRAEKERADTQAARERLTPLKNGWLGYWQPSPSRYSAKGSHCPRCKLRCAAAGAATVTPAN